MASTPLLNIPFPDEDNESWYQTYVSQMREMERLMLMGKLHSNLLIGGGGSLSFNIGTNTFSWTADFLLPVLHFGRVITIPYGPDGSTRTAALSEGSALVLEIPYAMNANVTKNFQVLNQLDIQNHQQWVAAIRLNNKVIVRGLGVFG